MGSSGQADVVRKLIKIGCDPPGVPCECKTTGDVETHDIGQIVVYLRAERRGGKAVVRCVLILSDFGIRHSQCIDRSRTEQICAADRDRIGSVISIRPRTQDILLACRNEIVFIGSQNTPEDRMFRTGLIINPAHPLVIVDWISLAVKYLPTLVIGLRKI